MTGVQPQNVVAIEIAWADNGPHVKGGLVEVCDKQRGLLPK
jgi:hypothetical protein